MSALSQCSVGAPLRADQRLACLRIEFDEARQQFLRVWGLLLRASPDDASELESTVSALCQIVEMVRAEA